MKCNFEKESTKRDGQIAVGEPEAFSSLWTVDHGLAQSQGELGSKFGSSISLLCNSRRGALFLHVVLASDKQGLALSWSSIQVISLPGLSELRGPRTSWNCPGFDDIKSKERPTLSLQRTKIWKAARDPIHSRDIHYLPSLMTSPWGFRQTQSLRPVGTRS